MPLPIVSTQTANWDYSIGSYKRMKDERLMFQDLFKSDTCKERSKEVKK
jgi:hypothetical protein